MKYSAVFSTALAFAAFHTSAAMPSGSDSNHSSLRGTSLLSARQASSSCEPAVRTVINAIDEWNTDVDTVNDFLDNDVQLTGTALQDAARNALDFANNEPVQLEIFACIAGITGGTNNPDVNALMNLMKVFEPGVINQLLNIIQNPNNNNVVQNAVDRINQVRCCNVLPDLDVLWLAAAETEGIVGQVNTDVPRPNACANIQCNNGN